MKSSHSPPSESEVRAALGRILESEEFIRSKRIGAFLRFVVEEALADRGDRLKAVTIAQDVFGRDESFDPRTDTIVRVEAGRLRRRLKRYYEASGREDSVLIEIPVGTYTPRFTSEWMNQSEAHVLYRQGLVLLMPPSDETRMLTARQLFRRATELDSDFAGGAAGEAFSHAVAVLFVNSQDPEGDLHQGKALAGEAIEKDPTFGMAYAALALACTLAGDLKKGLNIAKRAVAVQPADAYTWFVLGMALILSGRPEEAIEPLQESSRLNPLETRTPFLNNLGIAYLAAGKHHLALETFDRNDQRGGPTGPHMNAFRALAHAELGNSGKSRELMDEIGRSHPDFPIEKWLSRWLGTGSRLSRAMTRLNEQP